MTLQSFESHHPLVVPVLSLLLLAALGALGYEYYVLNLAANSYVHQVATLTDELAAASSTNQQLTDAYAQEKAVNVSLGTKINELSGTVGSLDKITKTDPQLLAKYSKIYFLNENYTPSSLSDIPSSYDYKGAAHQFLTPALARLTDMLNDAGNDGVSLQVLSAYRSFGEQTSLKSSYKVTYGIGANAFSADQGYSEHQLGTAADFTSGPLNGSLDGFDKTDAYTWLTKHAYRYGFILSYPSGNSFYVFEPWHWRYVGISLATRLHDGHQNFYDLDQREINAYLVSFF
jgi:LAS superfamily LD-carboxypeptidase LdcB